MRNRTKTIITSLIIAIIAIFTIQTIWILYSYKEEKSKIRILANNIIEPTVNELLYTEVDRWIQNIQNTYGEDIQPTFGAKNYQKLTTTRYVINPETREYIKYSRQYDSLQEIIQSGSGDYHVVGLDLDLLKSNLKSRFNEYDINTPFVLEKVKLKTGEVFDTTHGSNIEDYTNLCDTLELGITQEDGLVVKFNGSYGHVMQNIILYNLFSIFISFIIVYVVYLLIRVINQQDKLFLFRENFIKYMVHEIKNPLICIKHFLDISNSENDKGAQIAHKGMSDISALVEKILVATSDKLQINRKVINIRDVLSDIKNLYPRADISINIKDDISLVYADSLHYPNAIRNLVDNAVKYSLDNKHIEIECYLDKQFLCISVRDWGIGIPKAKRLLIYSRYIRLDSEKTNVKGFGLGLSYVDLVAQTYKGYIEMEDRGKVGSTFVLKIPYDND